MTNRSAESLSSAGMGEGGRLRWVFPLVVAVVTFGCFARGLTNELVDLDDVDLLVRNTAYRGVNLTSLRWMFTTFYMGPYQPLSWLTYAIDDALWGGRAIGFHLTNVLLHSAGAVACYFLILRLLILARGDQARPTLRAAAAIGALFFSIHPLRVESVAWATERRDVLSGLLYIGTIISYLRYVVADTGPLRRRRYVLTLTLYLLCVLAKATGMTLPIALLILDVYPLRRVGGATGWWRGASAGVWDEKIPFLILAVATGVLAIIGQAVGSTLSSLQSLGLPYRLVIATYATGFYLLKTIVPVGLAAFYEIPYHLPDLVPMFAAAAAVLVGLTIIAGLGRRRLPAFTAAWLFFLVTLAPVSGLAQAGGQIAADRYTYLPSLGVAALVAGWCAARMRSRAVVAVAALGVMATLTVRQVGFWRDSARVLDRMLTVDPRCSFARANQARLLDDEGRTEAALAPAAEAVRLRPNQPDHQLLYGGLLDKVGRFNESLKVYQVGASLTPPVATLRVEYAAGLLRLGRAAEAERMFEKALQADAGEAKALTGLGIMAAQRGDRDRARDYFRSATATGRLPAGGYARIASGWLSDHRPQDAVETLRGGLALFPNDDELLRTLAWIRATHPRGEMRNGGEAVELARRAMAASQGRKAQTLVVLAAALAETGRFDDARRALQQAIDRSSGAPPAILDSMRKQLAELAAGRPIRSEE